MIKELILKNQPKRYLVYNNKYLVLVTYNKFSADRLEQALRQVEYDPKYFPVISR